MYFNVDLFILCLNYWPFQQRKSLSLVFGTFSSTGSFISPPPPFFLQCQTQLSVFFLVYQQGRTLEIMSFISLVESNSGQQFFAHALAISQLFLIVLMCLHIIQPLHIILLFKPSLNLSSANNCIVSLCSYQCIYLCSHFSFLKLIFFSRFLKESRTTFIEFLHSNYCFLIFEGHFSWVYNSWLAFSLLKSLKYISLFSSGIEYFLQCPMIFFSVSHVLFGLRSPKDFKVQYFFFRICLVLVVWG